MGQESVYGPIAMQIESLEDPAIGEDTAQAMLDAGVSQLVTEGQLYSMATGLGIQPGEFVNTQGLWTEVVSGPGGEIRPVTIRVVDVTGYGGTGTVQYLITDPFNPSGQTSTIVEKAI